MTLREFTSNLETSNANETSSARKKSSRSSRRSGSKQPSSSSESYRRPVDSAYASMSTGHTSAGTSGRHSSRSRPKYSEQKVENYLKEIPSGLYPRHISMSEKQKKKLVVRRLEQLFTGKSANKHKPKPAEPSPASAQTNGDITSEPAREARISLTGGPTKKCSSRETNGGSASNSNGDQNSLSGSGGGTGSSSSPPTIAPPEQRPTRPRDLDPDRAQNPSENIEYLRHLGIAPPDIQQTEAELDKEASLSPDADGWVYLNLLYNLAQLHIYNVTLSFTRAAVSEKSSMFQMSADGCKIRWRGGTEGTRFSSDGSGDNMRKTKCTDDSSSPTNLSSNDRRIGGEDGVASRGPKSKLSEGKTSSDPSAARRSRFGAQSPQTAAESFQYKPLFVKNRSPNEQTSEDTGSSHGSRDESYFTGSPWAGSGSGSSLRRKRRVDGAIIYYSGAQFCTDLAGDLGTTLSSPLCEDPITEEYLEEAPPPHRTLSGSSLAYRPFSISRQDLLESRPADATSDLGMDMVDGESGDVEMACDFPWSDSTQNLQPRLLEPTGLGGVLPDDHFMVTVSTRRSRGESVEDVALSQFSPEARLNMVMERVNQLRASQERGYHVRTRCAAPPFQASAPGVEYVGGHIKRLKPASLPPPALFFPPFSTDESSEFVDGLETEADNEQLAASEAASRRVHPHDSDVSLHDTGVESSVSDEEGSAIEGSSSSSDAMVLDEGSGTTSPPEVRIPAPRSTSSVATAGDGPSGLSSSKSSSSDSSDE